jgi:hypothetical protein
MITISLIIREDGKFPVMGNLKADCVPRDTVLRTSIKIQADPESIVFEHVLVNSARIVKTSRETIIATP